MAQYQNSSVTASKLILGNYQIEYAATVGGSMVNLGAGIVNSFGHNLTKFDSQAGNAPDPVEGIARETFTISGELIEYNPTALSAIQCGGTDLTVSTTSILTGGGNQVLTPIAFQLTNTTTYSGSTYTTVIQTYKATLDAGIQFTAKSDNDSDPVNVMPFTITAKLDTSRTAGDQLFNIERTV